MPANITTFQAIGDLASLGTTTLTKLAYTFEQFPGDPIAKFFPVETTMNSSITIERVREGVGVAPLVEPGQTDVLTDSAQVERMQVFPAYMRESDFIPQQVINDLRKVGTLNEKEGKEFVAKRIQRLTNRSNHLFSVLRAQMLLGGINYVDPRTKKGLNVSANIPASNALDLSALAVTRHWSDQVNSTPVKDLIQFRRRIMNIAKVEPRYIIMNSDMQTILENNAEILRRQEVSFLSQTGFVTYREGKLVQIAGMEIITYDHIYQDPVTKQVKKLWPTNKVVILTGSHPDYPGAVIGRDIRCVGEDPMGRPGIWVRTGPDQQPPSAPGRTVQLGNAGLPYLIYPDWIGILTVGVQATLDAIVDSSVTNPF